MPICRYINDMAYRLGEIVFLQALLRIKTVSTALSDPCVEERRMTHSSLEYRCKRYIPSALRIVQISPHEDPNSGRDTYLVRSLYTALTTVGEGWRTVTPLPCPLPPNYDSGNRYSFLLFAHLLHHILRCLLRETDSDILRWYPEPPFQTYIIFHAVSFSSSHHKTQYRGTGRPPQQVERLILPWIKHQNHTSKSVAKRISTSLGSICTSDSYP